MSLSKLSKLPPEILSSVLNNRAIPLSRRLHLRLISNRWCDIIEDALKIQTSLVVCDEDAFYLKLKPDDLIIQSTDRTDRFTRPLARLFTSLTQLTFHFGVEASWNKIPSLLAHLDTSNLTSVILNGRFLEDFEVIEVEPIANALTALSGLTSLTLVGYQLSDLLLHHLGPVLTRLVKFGCLHDPDGIIASSLSPRCTHLWLDSADFESFNSSLLVELSSNLTHLHLADCDSTIWRLISQMHKLSRLTLDFDDEPELDSSFIRRLVPFSGLTQVTLYGLDCLTPLALPSKKETPLSSIKRLTLDVYFRYSPVDYQAFCQTIGVWFPSLAHLTLVARPDNIAAIQASLGKLPFTVKIVSRNSVDLWSPNW